MAFGKFGRYYPDGSDVRISRFDLLRLVRSEVDAVAEGKGEEHELRLDSALEELVLESDEQHVRFIVGNLLQNAVKYSAPGSTVRVALTLNGPAAEVRVADEGIGIPHAELEELFSPFYRASNTAGRPGTGMGLAIVKKSANLVGARVDVRTTLGSGTVFTVAVPTRGIPR